MWSLRLNKFGVLIAVGLFEAACSTAPASRVAADPAPAQVPAAAVTSAAPGAATPAADAGASAPTAVPQASLPPPPPRAGADFAHALELVRAGKDEEAMLAFQQVAAGYPLYAGALVNLGILYRKHGDLAKSEAALHAAVQREPGDAVACNELGVTLRLAGKFHEAADAYNQAIAAKPDFAPAYRNLAIVLDLYLGDTAGALTAMEHYKDLAADDKAVAGWVADLKQRAGKNAAPPAPDKAGG
jgi:Flp pilus assembly protein TadD